MTGNRCGVNESVGVGERRDEKKSEKGTQ